MPRIVHSVVVGAASLAIACGSAAEDRAPPADAPSSSREPGQAPQPRALCKHVLELKRASPREAEAFVTMCEVDEEGRRKDDEGRWRVRFDCVLAAGTVEEALACDALDVAPTQLDCVAALPPKELATLLGASVELSADGTDASPDHCSSTYVVAGRSPATLDVQRHYSSQRAAEEIAEEKARPGAIPLEGVGDGAVHTSDAFERGQLCRVMLAQGARTMRFSVARATCSLDELRAVAKALVR